MENYLTLALLKSAFMILFLVIVIVVGTLPLRSKYFKTNNLLISIGSTFAGALFINVAIIHILPESSITLQQFLQDGDSELQVFPLANLLLILGFLITIFFTKVISNHTHQHDEQQHIHQNHPNLHDNNKKLHDNQSIMDQYNQSSLQREHHNNNRQNQKNKQNQQIQSNGNKQISYHFAEGKKKKKSKLKNPLNQAYILTVAIYFHTVFEGIAIGVQTEISGFLSIAVAIAFHKWADALSMGCHYKSRQIPVKTAYSLIIGQAILNVIAIGMGWIISSSGEVTQAIFLSISAGTFLAISTMELLTEQLNYRKYITLKYLLIVAATIFVSVIWFVENQIF